MHALSPRRPLRSAKCSRTAFKPTLRGKLPCCSEATAMWCSCRLNVKEATTLFDLGMGRGKLAIQMFLTMPNLKRVVGVELSPSRGPDALQALRSSVRALLLIDRACQSVGQTQRGRL